MACAAALARWVGIGVLALAGPAARAEPRAADPPVPALTAASAAQPSALQLALPRAMREFRDENAGKPTRRSPFADLGVSVVELPIEGPPGPRNRAHHALSIATDAPRQFLRSMGIDATECATRFRLPAKVQRDAYGGSRVDVRAQLGLACGF